MYSVSVHKKFISQHYLPNELGKEQSPHSHHYTVEACVFGEILTSEGFLIDIIELQHTLDSLLIQFEDKLLNDLQEFRGSNPSLETVAFVIWEKIKSALQNPRITCLKVTVWEEEGPCASYEGAIVS